MKVGFIICVFLRSYGYVMRVIYVIHTVLTFIPSMPHSKLKTQALDIKDTQYLGSRNKKSQN